jgi:carboxylesterase
MPTVTAPIIPGAEPFRHDGGPLGVLVELPLWPGHGTAVEDMIPTRWSDWSEAAEAAYTELRGRCEAVALVGLSMGGTLACWLAEHHAEVRGLVLVNPLAEPPADTFRDVLRGMLDTAEVAPGIGSDIALAGSTEISYAGTPIAAVLSLFEGVDAVAARLGHVRCPVLLLSSREDHVVPSSSGDLLVDSVGGPIERVWLEKSYHVATLDHDEAEISRRAVEFVGRVLRESPDGEVGAGTSA